MSQFIEEASSAVPDALEAFVRTHDDGLKLLGDEKVVFRPTEQGRVALISGGGSGHEPAHIGFVAEGLLHAAVCGNVFASPAVSQISAAIEQVSSGAEGTLLILKNYTGDRLNFGLAAERSPSPVEMVIVGDDIAIEGAANPRGLCGVLLIHKIAGHLSRAGRSLSEIRQVCQEAADSHLWTLGASLSECSMPGAAENQSNRVASGFVEIGMGIHGEPGAETKPFVSLKGLVQDMASQLEKATCQAEESDRFLLVVNNLGSCNGIEIGCILSAFLETPLGAKVSHAVSGPLLTALNMHGFSLSLLRLSETILEALLSPVAPSSAWIPLNEVRGRKESIHESNSTNLASRNWSLESDSSNLCKLVKKACEVIIKNHEALDTLDRAVGDGDTGATLRVGAERVLESLNAKNSDADVFLKIGLASESIGGSSGVILSIFFTAVAQKIHSSCNLGDALRYGVERISFYGGAKIGDRTLLDALIPAIESQSLAAAAKAARAGADETAKMNRALAGRAAYLKPESLVGNPDPGAVAVALALEGMIE